MTIHWLFSFHIDLAWRSGFSFSRPKTSSWITHPRFSFDEKLLLLVSGGTHRKRTPAVAILAAGPWQMEAARTTSWYMCLLCGRRNTQTERLLRNAGWLLPSSLSHGKKILPVSSKVNLGPCGHAKQQLPFTTLAEYFYPPPWLGYFFGGVSWLRRPNH